MPNVNTSIPRVAWTSAARTWTWSKIVRRALSASGGVASLAQLYSIVGRHPRTKKRKHWKAKIRQVLEQSDDFVRVDSGVWSFASKHSAKTIKKLKRLRRTLYPKRAE
jgi:hypothetical protein